MVNFNSSYNVRKTIANLHRLPYLDSIDILEKVYSNGMHVQLSMIYHDNLRKSSI